MSIGSRCSEVEKGAARSEQVQRGGSRCSEIGAGAARLKKVQRGWSRCSEVKKEKNYKDALPPPLWYVSMLVLHVLCLSL